MSVPTPATPAEKSRTVTLRVDRQTRVARFDGVQDLHLGDSLICVVDSISGVDPANIQLWLWKKEANQTITDRLAFDDNFAAVTGFSSRASSEITFDSANLRAALESVAIGTPLVVRLILRETNMVLVDMDVNVFPNVALNADPAPDPDDVTANPYLRQDDFVAWATGQLALPLETQDDMAAIIANILNKLADPTH